MIGCLESRDERAVTVAGAGAWGTTLALVAHWAGRRVRLLAHRELDAAYIATNREHPRSLKGIRIPDEIEVASDPERAFDGTAMVIVAIPTQRLREFCDAAGPYLADKLILSAAKGIENETGWRPSQILAGSLGQDAVVALSGPNLATEIASGLPAAAVVAGYDGESTRRAQLLLHSSSFRVYTSSDVIGVELGGALKNVIAIAAGISDGLHLGDNAKASMMTRGIAEIARLGVQCGAERETFNGLSGFGDLIATCGSALSRNYRVGFALAQGKTLTEILAEQVETAEGIPTTRSALQLASREGVAMPITEQVSRVLFEHAAPREAIQALMGRQATVE
jgi:glycerol-3-phosphate dehydrogenase (NAD(P)+)